MTAAATPTTPDNTIVLIHGLWMTPLCWENWIARYESRGYRVLAPAWPGMDVDIEQLRRDTSAIDRLSVTEILAHYEKIIRELDSPPIIMGHSFGGGFTQVLLDRGLGAAGVAIDAATVKGVWKLPLTTLRSGWPVLKNPLNRHKAVGLSLKQFHYAFTNTLSEEESAKVYERYHIPGPGGVLFEGATVNLPGTALRVDPGKADRAPLLFIAGGADHIVPPVANTSNVKLYRKSKSEAIVDYKEFRGRSHYTLGQDGWEEVADYALDWAESNAGLSAGRGQNVPTEDREQAPVAAP
jgi:pimeloyl-ACP methyl ester carboxylesterase